MPVRPQDRLKCGRPNDAASSDLSNRERTRESRGVHVAIQNDGEEPTVPHVSPAAVPRFFMSGNQAQHAWRLWFNDPRHRALAAGLAVLLLILALAGCGSGVGGALSPTAPTATPTWVSGSGPPPDPLSLQFQGAKRWTTTRPVDDFFNANIVGVTDDVLSAQVVVHNSDTADVTYDLSHATLRSCDQGTCGQAYPVCEPQAPCSGDAQDSGGRYTWTLAPGQSPDRGAVLPGTEVVVPLVFLLGASERLSDGSTDVYVQAPPPNLSWTLDSGYTATDGSEITWTFTA